MEEEDRIDRGLISVIVPVYNPGALLSLALESLRSQEYGNFEAILVDDGSTDRSPQLCRDYAGADSRFRYVRQENGGVSAARNKGIDMARGEWIAFMDADDIMPEKSLRIMIEAASESRCRIVAGQYSRDVSANHNSGTGTIHTISSEDAIRTGLYQKRILNNPWGVLFHHSVFEEPEPLRFRHCRYEDLDLFYRAFERVSRICLVDSLVYVYRDNPGGFINTWSDSRLDVLDVTDRMVDHMKESHPGLVAAAEDRRFSAHCNMLVEMTRHGIRNSEARERCIRVIRERRRAELLDPEVRIKNKLGALASYVAIPIIRMLCR